MANAFLGILTGIGELGGEQDAGADVFRDELKLLAENYGHTLADRLAFFLVTQSFLRLMIRNVGVVVVAVGFEGAFGERRGLFKSAGGEIGAAQNVPGAVAIGFPFDGPLGEHGRFFVLLLGVGHSRARHQNFRQVGSESSGAIAGGEAALDPFLTLFANFVDQTAEVGDAAVGQREIRVELDGLLEHLQAVIVIFAAGVISATQIKVVGLRIFGGFARDGFFFLRGQRDAQSLGDAARDFFLNGENVFELAVVALGPDGMAGGGFHQLGGDAHPAARTADRTFEDVSCAELLADLLGGDRFVAEGEHFGARKNLQLGDFGNFGDDVFGDAVAKIFVFFGAALIFEIKDGDGFAFLLDRMRGGAGAGSAFFGGGPAAGFEVAAEAFEVGAQFGSGLAAQVGILFEGFA